MPTVRRGPGTVYQLKITLKGSKPPIWRRLQVQSDTTLARLHMIFQIAMGWTDSHLHVFRIGEVEYGAPDPDWDLTVRDAYRVRLGQVVKASGERFAYTYDFGDGWDHVVLVEKVLPPEPDRRYPIVLTGRRACPPEDVGGVWQYSYFLTALANPERAEHEMWQEWVGDAFDSEAFDVDAINRTLLGD